MGASGFEALRLDRITRRFGDQVALRELDLTIRGGEFVALLGPSGCGKSTALNCLAGLLPLSGGSIWLDERRIDTVPPERRGFGMVFQNYALFPHLSVRANIAFGLAMHRVPKAEAKRRVEDVIRLVQLTEHAHKHPAQLSGGQQQRVAIARAIVLEPPLVLMDEPLSNLDAKLRLEMRTEIRRLHQRLDLTTVYVTHDQEEALSMADRLVVLRDGEVQQVGTPEEVYAEPVNRYVAGFMGYRNMLAFGVESCAGGEVTLAAGSARLTGVNRDGVRGGTAVAAIRPEDVGVVEADAANRVPVTVEVVEYHGREQAVQARLQGGEELHFRTTRRLAPGDQVDVGAPPERVLVFGTDDAGTGGEGRAVAPDARTTPARVDSGAGA
ncbi:MAG: ABC transporter ATP-binding protein [Streptosporangiales bacterium]|nr:ABC transporter ATP-binding protein [Streptosporangiales bacterium]MBO0889836.1 ABC transporter ATP-binding protein [Acidothermales bacterium]